MSHTPPPRESGGLSAIWFILGGLVVLAVLYFAFFAGGPAQTPTTGNSVTVETPAATPATPAPAPEAATPPAADTAPAAPAPATPAPTTPAPAN